MIEKCNKFISIFENNVTKHNTIKSNKINIKFPGSHFKTLRCVMKYACNCYDNDTKT